MQDLSSNSDLKLTVRAIGPGPSVAGAEYKPLPELSRTVAECYTLVRDSLGDNAADLWLLSLGATGSTEVNIKGVTVRFSI